MTSYPARPGQLDCRWQGLQEVSAIAQRLDSRRQSRVRGFTACIGLGALVLGALVAPNARAENPSCHLVTDGTGDAQNVPGTGQAVLPNQDDLDITSGDVATNRRVLTTVVRVKDLSYALSSAPRTREYLMYFHIGKTDLRDIRDQLPRWTGLLAQRRQGGRGPTASRSARGRE